MGANGATQWTAPGERVYVKSSLDVELLPGRVCESKSIQKRNKPYVNILQHAVETLSDFPERVAECTTFDSDKLVRDPLLAIEVLAVHSGVSLVCQRLHKQTIFCQIRKFKFNLYSLQQSRKQSAGVAVGDLQILFRLPQQGKHAFLSLRACRASLRSTATSPNVDRR